MKLTFSVIEEIPRKWRASIQIYSFDSIECKWNFTINFRATWSWMNPASTQRRRNVDGAIIRTKRIARIYSPIFVSPILSNGALKLENRRNSWARVKNEPFPRGNYQRYLWTWNMPTTFLPQILINPWGLCVTRVAIWNGCQ